MGANKHHGPYDDDEYREYKSYNRENPSRLNEKMLKNHETSWEKDRNVQMQRQPLRVSPLSIGPGPYQ